jgi:hypothetical protein
MPYRSVRLRLHVPMTLLQLKAASWRDVRSRGAIWMAACAPG